MWRNPAFVFEFARPPFAWQRLTVAGCLLLALAGVWLADLWQAQAASVQAVERLQQQIAQMTQQPPQAVLKQPSQTVLMQKQTQAGQQTTGLSDAQKKEAEKMAKLLTIRWFDLLEVLEARQVDHIALLQLTPDAGRGQFVLTGEAQNYQTLLQYVGSLQQASALHDVHLQKHQVNEAHPQRPVAFEVQGAWQP